MPTWRGCVRWASGTISTAVGRCPGSPSRRSSAFRQRPFQAARRRRWCRRLGLRLCPATWTTSCGLKNDSSTGWTRARCVTRAPNTSSARVRRRSATGRVNSLQTEFPIFGLGNRPPGEVSWERVERPLRFRNLFQVSDSKSTASAVLRLLHIHSVCVTYVVWPDLDPILFVFPVLFSTSRCTAWSTSDSVANDEAYCQMWSFKCKF